MAELLRNPIRPLNFHEQSKAKRTTCILWENTSFSRNFSLVQQNKRHRHNSGNDARKLDELQVNTWMRREGYLLFYRESACHCIWGLENTGLKDEGYRQMLFSCHYIQVTLSQPQRIISSSRQLESLLSFVLSMVVPVAFCLYICRFEKSLKFLNHNFTSLQGETETQRRATSKAGAI